MSSSSFSIQSQIYDRVVVLGKLHKVKFIKTDGLEYVVLIALFQIKCRLMASCAIPLCFAIVVGVKTRIVFIKCTSLVTDAFQAQFGRPRESS